MYHFLTRKHKIDVDLGISWNDIYKNRPFRDSSQLFGLGSDKNLTQNDHHTRFAQYKTPQDKYVLAYTWGTPGVKAKTGTMCNVYTCKRYAILKYSSCHFVQSQAVYIVHS